MSIYTKKGDFGETSLADGVRISKSSLRIEAYGNLDELNSYVGLIRSYLKKNEKLFKDLVLIQSDLMIISSYLAKAKIELLELTKRTKEMESDIDKIASEIPPMTQFILPGGSKPSAHLQVARTIARRAERGVISLSKKENVEKEVIKYLNRLSDLLYSLSLKYNFDHQVKETFWKDIR